MDIRIVDKVEMPHVRGILVRGLHDYPEAFAADYEWAHNFTVEGMLQMLHYIRASGGFILGTFEDGKPIGMLHFNHQNGEKVQHKGDILAVYVIPEQRGKGIATKLLKTALGENTQT